MRERVLFYGGELETGPRPEGGFDVRASLPVEAPPRAATGRSRGGLARSAGTPAEGEADNVLAQVPVVPAPSATADGVPDARAQGGGADDGAVVVALGAVEPDR